MRRLWVPVAALLAIATGCHKSHGEAGHLLLVEGTTGNRGIYSQSLDKDKASDLVMADSVDGVPFAAGQGLIGTRSTLGDGDQLTRIAPSANPGAKTANALGCKIDFLSTVFAVDDSGKHVLVKKMERGIDKVRFLDTDSCTSTDLDLRFSYRGDVAPDGTEAVIGGAPMSCTEKDAGRCPVTLHRLRLPGTQAGSQEGVEVLRGGARAHYMPRYAGDRILFQTTERDTTCDGAINHCRHDVVSILRSAPAPSAGSAGPLELVREGAVNATVSLDGKRIAYLAYLGAETECHGLLPCSSMTLKVGSLDGPKDSRSDVAIAQGRVASIPPHAFSLDGRYIVFSAQVPSNKRVAEVCRADGAGECQTFGEMRILGWMK